MKTKIHWEIETSKDGETWQVNSQRCDSYSDAKGVLKDIKDYHEKAGAPFEYRIVEVFTDVRRVPVADSGK